MDAPTPRSDGSGRQARPNRTPRRNPIPGAAIVPPRTSATSPFALESAVVVREPPGAPERPRVLAVDDDATVLQTEAESLRKEGYLVEVARSGQDGLRRIRRIPIDVVVTDLDMPSVHGMLTQVREIDPDLPVLICASGSDLAKAEEAVRQGAYDYLIKPLQVSTLLIRVGKALERRRLAECVRELERRYEGRNRLGQIVGASTAMQRVYLRIEESASCMSRVLILGERGSGKELAAREIHHLSRRRDEPFHVVRCADSSRGRADRGPPADGHDRSSAAPGWRELLEVSTGGTLFLDEVQMLSLENQVWLARTLEAQESTRGASGPEATPAVRIIAASAADLDGALEKHAFLGELYSQLSEVVLRVPPLRERADDTELLAAHILDAECVRLGRPLMRLSPRSLELLTGHDWPGNVTELRAVLQGAVASAKGRVISPHDLAEFTSLGATPGQVRTLEELERCQIEAALKRTSGNKSRAARLLGIPRSTFYRKIGARKGSQRRP